MENSIKGIIWKESADSTSACLRRMLEESIGKSGAGLPDRTVYAAGYQTAGRGRGDHKWQSGRGENLLFSIFLQYGDGRRMQAAQQELLTMAASLAVCDFLLSEGIDAHIKFPNDILVGRRKICGILIENSLHGTEMNWSIVGIGLNVNQKLFPEDIPDPVSMSMLTGKAYDLKKCLRSLLDSLYKRLDEIWAETAALREEYASKLPGQR